MGLSAKAGNFALDTSTGNQAVAGVGFQPEIVLFFPSMQTVDGIGADYQISFGAGISSSERGVVTANDEDSVGTTDSTRSQRTDECIVMLDAGTTNTIYEADLVSLDADGFTINITDAPGSGYRVGYLALAGTDLTNVAIGNFQADNATGEQDITGVGFQPDAVIVFAMKGITAGDDLNHTHFIMGFATSSTQRCVFSNESTNNEVTSNSGRVQFTDSFIAGQDSSGLDSRADFVSMDADGFTINWSDAIDRYFYYIALKGGQYAVGSLTTQTGTGNFSETGVGFQGAVGIFLSFCNAASAAARVDHAEVSLGIASSSSDRFVVGATSEDGQGTSDCDNFSDDGKIYKNYDFAQSLEGDIDFVSWDADGFTLDQTDADPSGNEMVYLVIGALVTDLNINVTDCAPIEESLAA